MQQKPQTSRGLPLRLVLIAPFVVQITAAVGITGWISYENGQRIIKELASEMLFQAKYRVKERMDRLLSQSQLIVAANAFAYQQNQISLDRPIDLQLHFSNQIAQNAPFPRSIFVGDREGKFLGVYSYNAMSIIDRPASKERTFYTIDNNGNRLQKIDTDSFDPTQRPWYNAASQNKTDRETVWTDIYWFATSKPEFGITAAQAIRDRTGRLIAVTAVDLGLSQLDDFFRTSKVSHSSQIFAIDRAGFLVASSLNQPLATEKKQILAQDSQFPIIRESARYFQQDIENLDRFNQSLSMEFSIQNERHFLSVVPVKLGENLEWRVLIAVSERDFTRQIEDNNRTTLLLCGISLFIAIAVGMLTSRSLTKTILHLAKAVDDVAQGDWESQKNWQPQNIPNASAKEMNVLVNSFDSMVDRLQNVFTKLEDYAYVDAVTGLPNQAAFLLHLQQAMSTAKTHIPPSFAVLILDLDSFRLIENGLGQATADLLLKSVAARLVECLKNSEVIISRIERDEFAILLTNISSETEAVEATQTILQAFQRLFRVGQQDLLASASIGVIVDRGEFEQAEEIMRNANIARFSAKDREKDRYVVFDSNMRSETTEKIQLAADLQYAIDRDELEIHYQPIFRIMPTRVVSFEALLRWRHPSLGLISPTKFIPIAEETGTIVRIGTWVLRTACQQMRTWQTQSDQLKSVLVNVNVSPQQLLMLDFVDLVTNILQETGLDGKYLQLEITESAAVSQTANIAQKLIQLQALGVKICIDDFGTGYSQLSYLLQLPIDVLKIDRSFVGDIGVNPKSGEIAKTVLALANCLGIEAIAEGVETAEQFQQLKSLNCRKFQGYLFSPPIAAQEVLNFSPKISIKPD